MSRREIPGDKVKWTTAKSPLAPGRKKSRRRQFSRRESNDTRRDSHQDLRLYSLVQVSVISNAKKECAFRIIGKEREIREEHDDKCTREREIEREREGGEIRKLGRCSTIKC